MASIYTSKAAPIRGPYLKHAFAKSVLKGEDAWLQQRDLQVSVPATAGTVTLDAFGVFDGHGGKQAATFASKHMTVTMLEELQAHMKTGSSLEQNGIGIPAKHSSDSMNKDPAEEQLASCSAVKEEDWALWRAQDAAVEALPQALVSTFQRVESDFFIHGKVSGSTATLVVICGWEAVIANVGDSCAYIDTGGEVVLVSGNHRLDDNKAERLRCEEAGREVSSSAVEGRPVGPLRVWPGGLNMSRTIGDYEAGDVVTCEPELRQVTLPVGGARLVIASDGLWDALNPKTALHHARGMPASKAATELVQMALKSKAMRDDVTVIVIDVLTSEDDRTPAALQRKNGTATVARSAGSGSLSSMEIVEAMSGSLTDQVTVLRPLEQSSHDSQWRKAVWERRLVAVQTTYGALLPPDLHSSSDMSIALALSDTNMASSFETTSMADYTCDSSPNARAGEHLLFGNFDEDDQEDDAWETVPMKSKARKHSSELDAAAVPPTKEPRADLPRSESLSSDSSAALLSAASMDEKANGFVQPGEGHAIPRGNYAAAHGLEGNARQPRNCSGRGRSRGRGRGRGPPEGFSRQQQQQRMGRIEEGPEGGSPPRAEGHTSASAFAAAAGVAGLEAAAAGAPHDRRQGGRQYRQGPPRGYRRQHQARAIARGAVAAPEGHLHVPAGVAVVSAGEGHAEGSFQHNPGMPGRGRGRGRHNRHQGRGGYCMDARAHGGFSEHNDAPHETAQAACVEKPAAHGGHPAQLEQHLGQGPPSGDQKKEGPREPRSFRGRSRGRGRGRPHAAPSEKRNVPPAPVPQAAGV